MATWRGAAKPGPPATFLQNLPKKEGIRGIFVPSPGHVFYACDYSQIELVCLGYHCLKTQGASTLADTINKGVDCHKFLAGKIYRCPIGDVTKDMRQLSKAASFGLPGGLSPTTFTTYAKGYGVDINVEQATEVKRIWMESFPEMERHLNPPRSAEGDWFMATNIMGMIRGKCSYTETCNYPFQSLAALGLKRAIWKLLLAGAPMANEIHDEVIYELPIGSPKEMTEMAEGYAEIQRSAMQELVPDVMVKTEGALMDRWYKRDGERDGDGYLKVLTEEQ